MRMKKMILKITAWLAISCLLLPGAALVDAAPQTSAPLSEEGDGWFCYEQQGALRLLAHPQSGTVALEDTATGRRWQTNPINYKEDPIARGSNRTKLGSQLLISYVDVDRNLSDTNSVKDCDPDNGGILMEYKQDALWVTYTFEEAQIILSLVYRVENGGLQVEVPFESIRETGDNVLTKVTVLPNFGAAAAEEEGYFILPDGCGALLRFNNKKTNAQKVQLAVYGTDGVYRPTTTMLDLLPATLPVYGAVFGEQTGYMAVAEKGAAGATLEAVTGGVESSYSAACFSFAYRACEEVVFLDRTNAAVSMYMTAPINNQGTAFAVGYYLLNESEAHIAGVADKYRRYLEADGFKKQEDLSFVSSLTVLSGAQKRKTFLGIPYTAYEPLTTWEALGEMVDAFAKEGDVSVTLKDWSKNGAAAGRIDGRWNPASSLGSKASLTALLQRDDVTVYPFAELNLFQKSGNGVRKMVDSIISVDRKRLSLYTHSMVTGQRVLDGKESVLLAPAKVLAMGEKLRAAFEKKEIGRIALSGVANRLYTDLGREKVGLDQTQRMFEQLLEDTAATLDCSLESPNAYAIPYATEITGLPVRSNGFDMEDETIPFLQMVLQGYIRHYNQPLNLCADNQKALLFAIESGSMPSFALMQSSFDKLDGTSKKDWYSSEFSLVKDDCLEQTAQLKAALEGLGGAKVVQYSILENGVRRIQYDSGDVLYVNYTENALTADGVTLPAMSYERSRAEVQ